MKASSSIGRLKSTDDDDDHRSFIIGFTLPILQNLQAHKHPEWRGPSLGPKPAEENRREFSEDVLRAGEGVIGLQAGTNNFATQSGQSFGASRKIILGKWSVPTYLPKPKINVMRRPWDVCQ